MQVRAFGLGDLSLCFCCRVFAQICWPFRFALCGQVRGRGLGAVSFNASSQRLEPISTNKTRSLPTHGQTSDTVIYCRGSEYIDTKTARFSHFFLTAMSPARTVIEVSTKLVAWSGTTERAFLASRRFASSSPSLPRNKKMNRAHWVLNVSNTYSRTVPVSIGTSKRIDYHCMHM